MSGAATKPRLTESAEWRALLARGRERNRKADELAAAGAPVRFLCADGSRRLASVDTYPGSLGYRLTTFLPDGTPWGHIECRTLREAIWEGLSGAGTQVIAADPSANRAISST